MWFEYVSHIPALVTLTFLEQRASAYTIFLVLQALIFGPKNVRKAADANVKPNYTFEIVVQGVPVTGAVHGVSSAWPS